METLRGVSRGRMDGSSDPAPTLAGLPGATDHRSTAERDSGRKQIEALAYQFWEERGRPIGSPEEDWFRAESEIGSERTGAA